MAKSFNEEVNYTVGPVTKPVRESMAMQGLYVAFVLIFLYQIMWGGEVGEVLLGFREEASTPKNNQMSRVLKISLKSEGFPTKISIFIPIRQLQPCALLYLV